MKQHTTRRPEEPIEKRQPPLSDTLFQPTPLRELLKRAVEGSIIADWQVTERSDVPSSLPEIKILKTVTFTAEHRDEDLSEKHFSVGALVIETEYREEIRFSAGVFSPYQGGGLENLAPVQSETAASYFRILAARAGKSFDELLKVPS